MRVVLLRVPWRITCVYCVQTSIPHSAHHIACCVFCLFREKGANASAGNGALASVSIKVTVRFPKGLNASTATLTLGTIHGDAFLATRTLQHTRAADIGKKSVKFGRLTPGTAYYLKVEGQGYEAVPTQVVELAGSTQTQPDAVVAVGVTLKEAASTDTFRYAWSMDASRAGAAATVHVVAPPVVEFLGRDVVLSDDQAAHKLHRTHGILLADTDDDRDGVAFPWSSEYAYRLLETVSAIPVKEVGAFKRNPSKWILVEGSVANDIATTTASTGERTVRISAAAFTNASPQTVTMDGVRGTFFSRRLHHAVVRFMTRNGKDTDAVQHIMTSRYGCTTRVPSGGYDYQQLTAPTTKETAAKFQPFEKHPEEPLLLLGMFEELPQGFHAVPGLGYLLRRADGFKHPLHPTAPAVAWPTAHARSYIEFMESAFGADTVASQSQILT